MADIDLAARVAEIAARSKAKRASDQQAIAEQGRVESDQRAAQSEQLRAAMPNVANAVDQFRDVFGEVSVLAAEENGRVVKAERRLKALGLI